MEKVVKIVHQKKQGNDLDFWLDKSYVERLEAIEILREQYYLINKNADRRLQRVLTIVERRKG